MASLDSSAVILIQTDKIEEFTSHLLRNLLGLISHCFIISLSVTRILFDVTQGFMETLEELNDFYEPLIRILSRFVSSLAFFLCNLFFHSNC